MLPDGQKSWLLGAGYTWRTRAKSGVNDDKEAGLSLIQTHPINEQPLAKPRVPPRYQFKRIGYDIDRERREVLAYTTDGKLRNRWGPRDAEGNDVPPSDPAAWDPVDIAGDDDCVFILDQRYQVIYTHTYGRESLSLLIRSDKPDSRWGRIALDEHGCLLVFDYGTSEARCYGRRGRFLGVKTAPWPAEVPMPSVTSAQQAEPTDETSYEKQGYWISETLDSGIYNCQWHRIEMALSEFPPGTQIEVQAFSYASKDQAPVSLNDPRWVPSYFVVAPLQPSPEDLERERARRLGTTTRKPTQVKKRPRLDEFLIQAAPGQYLSLLVLLRGDGFGTPVVRSLRVHYPRESYLEYLPPLYSANEPMRAFLDRFLSIFQTEWDEFDRRVEESEAFADPDAVAEGVAMTYLASWLGLELEGEWTGEENRHLLQAVPKIYPRRGTPAALRDYVGVYLANLARLTPEQVAETSFPAIVEGFHERQYLMLSEAGGSTLGRAKPLFSPAVVRRLQLGVFAREGEVELVSTGDPERDFFHHFAHRFRVYVPAAWLRTAGQEQMLRRAIEAEMPAHVQYELCLVEAGMRVGIQSTVGLDTIIGDAPPWRLPRDIETQAPSLPPSGRLGDGTVLSRGSGSRPAVLDSTARVGDWTLD